MEDKYFVFVILVSLFFSSGATDKRDRFTSFLVNADELKDALNEANALNTKIKEELKEANETRQKQQEQIEEMQQKLNSKQYYFIICLLLYFLRLEMNILMVITYDAKIKCV